MIAARITRLTLTHFRNYRSASLTTTADQVVLVGPNGAGKTNCLEAVSLLAPGRGLRRARLEDIAGHEGDGSWAVSAEVEGALGLATLGTGIEPPRGDVATTRRCRIDREPVGSAAAFGDHLRMVWLTPSMDGLFMGAASERRRFFDRLVLAIDSGHSARVSALDRSLRSRNRLLEDIRNADSHWLDAIERETAELAIAVAAQRGQTATKLAAMIDARGATSAFPSARIILDGWMESALASEPATVVEDRYRAVLRDNRSRDAAAGRTLDGPHLTDLEVIYAPKAMPAREASTGEQKALLIGLVLAHAQLVAETTSITPLLLLDEVVAHLDPGRRAALFGELSRLGAQVWMTGADPLAFAEIGPAAAIFDVDNGRISARG
ncbi:DNA replication/repair protein RecF [Rhodopseudomonas palustris]|uniref:DNA replication/repair protein RecF n=1 Tax=Rhodopseudomonas palustris TaxID=1076 RepID=UPI00115E9408|nr:DNA replication/repair protein RecF [Rhodopseudomonas palustris]QDL99962.1 DNA replication/repair protein RecF [Rhodopseudomonas palustris]